ncbi:ABC transporter substrate-binding protein [Cytobacillus oceanisediminis]|nr:ABC transporter substrate-binding protein [Cytobacillus oceanisediminis]
MLKKGFSSIKNKIAIIESDPFACTWLKEKDKKTAKVELEANIRYRNPERGPRLKKVVFRNDFSYHHALSLCMNSEGQVDIVTKVRPKDAGKVVSSPFAKLVNEKSNTIITGIFNRFVQDLPFTDWRLREGANLAINREKIVHDGFKGYADIVPALTLPWSKEGSNGLRPKPFDPIQAKELLEEVGWPSGRILRIASFAKYKGAARAATRSIQDTIGISVSVTIIPDAEKIKWMQVLSEKKLIPYWDLLIIDISAFFLEDMPAYFHRELFGFDGSLRAGPRLKSFEHRFTAFAVETNRNKRKKLAQEIDQYVYHEALALFLCSPRELYAVKKNVNFIPFRTTFELAETEVTANHWSLR